MSVPLRHAAEVLLGRQRAPEYEHGEGQTPYLRSANIKDGRLDLTDVKSMRFSGSERVLFGLQSGDVLVTEGSGSRDSVGASAVFMGELPEPVCFQNTLLRLRPRAGTSGRYLAWWARHAHASGLIAAVASGANILHVGADAMGALPIEVPSFEEQRRIADFLDDQVARVHAAIMEAEALRNLAASRLEAQRQEWVERTSSAERRPLRSLFTYFQDGDWIEAPYISDEGVRLLQTGNIGVGQLRLASERYISEETFTVLKCKWVLPGDVLICRLGSPVSRAARVPKAFNPSITSVDVVICRGPVAGVEGDYVVEYMSTAAHLQPTDYLARGATMQRLSRSQVGALRIPVPSVADQQAMVSALRAATEQDQAAAEQATRIVDLLEERKRALITACVTGEFDVSTASTRAADAALQGIS